MGIVDWYLNHISPNHFSRKSICLKDVIREAFLSSFTILQLIIACPTLFNLLNIHVSLSWVSTLMLLVANFANTKWCRKPERLWKPWNMGTHLRVLGKSYSMNTDMTGLRWFQKSLRACALDKSSLSIGRVKEILFNDSLQYLHLYLEYMHGQKHTEIFRKHFYHLKNIYLTVVVSSNT